jgi:S1-C subfamily serine protease
MLVTNRHVVEDSTTTLEISTWDGRDLLVDVFRMSVVADLAFLQTKQDLPVIAKIGIQPGVGEQVAAVGYPLGGPWTLSRGSVVDYADGSVYGVGHEVIVFDAYVAPGNSGGPLFNKAGDVVGVVFARESSGAMRGLAIPIDTLKKVLTPDALSAPQHGC